MSSQLNPETRLDLLKEVGIFAESSSGFLKVIANVTKEVQVSKGQAIIKKGEEGNAMYVIASGRVRIHDGNHVYSRLERGQVFGEFSLIDSQERSASVTAEEPSLLLKLMREDFQNAIRETDEFSKGVVKKLTHRIREMNELESKVAKSYLKIQKQKKQIEEKHQQLLEQKKLLVKTNKRLEELNEEKNHLISVIAHGLRNPLSSSICAADLLVTENEQLTESQAEYSQLIYNSLRRMNNMINQVLDVDVIETHRSSLKPGRVKLAEVVRQAGDSFRYVLKLKNLELIMDLEEADINADRSFLLFIIDNLISNAIKFSPTDNAIILRTEVEDDQAIIRIKDNGPGIRKNEINKIFKEPPGNVAKQISGEESAGSGLYLVRKYTQLMNGVIDCKSSPGQGTEFLLRFPKID